MLDFIQGIALEAILFAVMGIGFLIGWMMGRMERKYLSSVIDAYKDETDHLMNLLDGTIKNEREYRG